MEKKPIAIRFADEVEAHGETRKQLDAMSVQVADLSAQVAAVMAERDTIAANLAESVAAIAERDQKIEEQAASIADRDSEISDLKGKLALSPGHIDVSGADPVADLPASDSQPNDWPSALKACNGDYVEARRKFPKQYDAFMGRS